METCAYFSSLKTRATRSSDMLQFNGLHSVISQNRERFISTAVRKSYIPDNNNNNNNKRLQNLKAYIAVIGNITTIHLLYIRKGLKKSAA
jgi:hypothetical protein